MRRAARRLRATVVNIAGGPARARVVITLAAVLGLSGADTGTISATANNLESVFHVGNTQIGVLLSVVSLAAAVFTIPAGVLTDRTRRTRLLGMSVLVWGMATVLSGAATSYLWLLAVRVGLGAAIATSGPVVASLTGDYFPVADRGRMYGLILGGDLLGTGLGYLVSGDLSSLAGWRVAFWWLGVPSLALALLVWRLPEPARGGASRIGVGEEEIWDERDVRARRRVRPSFARRSRPGAQPGQPGAQPGQPGAQPGQPGAQPGQPEPGLAERAVRRAAVRPQEELVLREDPTNRSIWWAIRYVLRVRTNVVIILASSLGYFYFAGLRSFAIIFATRHFGLSKPTATALIVVVGAGALAGVFTGGRIADRRLRRGDIRARVIVPTVCLLTLPLVLAPAFITRAIAIALPLLIVGAFLLGAPNPPLDAARLDIMHARLWGRAEGVRTVLRSLAEAAAPVLFGVVSQYVFGGPGASAGSVSVSASGSTSQASAGSATGLEYAFLVFLVTLLAAGVLALAAMRTYPRDVATANASARAIRAAADGAAADGAAADGPAADGPDGRRADGQ